MTSPTALSGRHTTERCPGVSAAILAVKVNEGPRVANDLLGVASRLVQRGAGVILVGCTELSMCLDALRPAGVPLVDPMRVLARHLVATGLRNRENAILERK